MTSTAELILERFARHRRAFDDVTARAQKHFERADWHAARRDAISRLNLYGDGIRGTVEALRDSLGDRFEDRSHWSQIRSEYEQAIATGPDRELAETWFNSVTRKVFDTVGVDAAVEFVDEPFSPAAASVGTIPLLVVETGDDPVSAIERLARSMRFSTPFENLPSDARAVVARIEGDIRRPIDDVAAFEVVAVPFFRGQGAYLIGRLAMVDEARHPFVMAIRNPAGALQIDAVLTEEDDVSILFSFTRAYFHVEAAQPSRLVAFLESIMPRKRVAELYTSIGFNKHGKTELFRDLLRHVRSTDQRFTVSRGAVGLVMIVFDMDDYDIVFKIIRDRFPPPKTTTRGAVMDRYRLVFEHDRAGRLVEAHEFEHLSLGVGRFAPELLETLRAEATRTVSLEDGRLNISHAYLERKVTPLNVYLREQPRRKVEDAIIAYGRCIKDLMASDIFPGDMLLKNFGVTRHGRVVFYDYDELGHITDCRFRAIPQTDDPLDEMSDTPWFSVGEGDVFPEEFPRFMGLSPDLMAVFREHHGDLFDHRTWNGFRSRLLDGERIEIFPYGPELRIPRSEVGPTRLGS